MYTVYPPINFHSPLKCPFSIRKYIWIVGWYGLSWRLNVCPWLSTGATLPHLELEEGVLGRRSKCKAYFLDSYVETASEPLLTCLQRMNELAEVVGPDFGRHIGFQAVSGNLDLTVLRWGWNMIELMSWGHKALLHTLLVTVRMCLTYSYRVEQHRQLVKLPSWVRGVHLISKCAIVENKFQSETGLQHVCGLFSCSAFLRIATNAVARTLTERWAKTSQPWAIDRGGPMIDLKGRA